MNPMEKEYSHKGVTYWVKVELAANEITGQTAYIAFVSEGKPGAIIYGTCAKDQFGRVMLFADVYTAFINANAIKQGEIDSSPENSS
jgi:hypothetical protein